MVNDESGTKKLNKELTVNNNEITFPQKYGSAYKEYSYD